MNCSTAVFRHLGIAAIFALLGPTLARAESARFYELEGFGHFLEGNPESTSVTEEGLVSLPPQVKERFADAAVSFSAACGMGDQVVVARTDDAQVLAVDAAGKTHLLFRPHEPLVTALWAHGTTLYVATAPGGKIYRLVPGQAPSLFFTAEAKFVWGLTGGPKDSILAVTGEPGTLVEINAQGRGKVLFAPDQAHLRSLAYDAKLGYFVGGGERGVLYRGTPDATASGDFRALYDTSTAEVTTVIVHDGACYLAGVSGAAALAQEDAKKKAEVRSQIMRVFMDGTAEVLAGSADEAVFGMAIDNQHRVLVATGATGRDDPRGRIYSIDAPRRVISLLYQSPSKRLTHLVPVGKNAVAAVGAGGGRITELTPDMAESGVFLTQPFDAGINAKFGTLQALGHFPSGTRTELQVRTGQTAEPDALWSPWSKALTAPGNAGVQVANGKYVQVRMTLHSHRGVSPQVQRLRLAYLRQNLAPFVREVSSTGKGLALYPLPHDDSKTKVMMLGEKAEAHSGAEEATRRQAPQRVRQTAERGSMAIKWLADDPNGDELRFELQVRPVGEAVWTLLKDNLSDPFFTLQTSQFPDGYYIFRVRADDGLSNPDGLERADSRESRAILIDNTAPKFGPLNVKQTRGTTVITTTVADSVSPLTELTYALDAQPPRPILPDDGVLDGPQEALTLRLGSLKPGRHTLTLRAVDEADNEGFAELVLR
jgi:hypothetical protein